MGKHIIGYEDLFESREELNLPDAIQFMDTVKEENPELIGKFRSIIINKGLEEAKKRYVKYTPKEVRKSERLLKKEQDLIDLNEEIKKLRITYSSELALIKTTLEEMSLLKKIQHYLYTLDPNKSSISSILKKATKVITYDIPDHIKVMIYNQGMITKDLSYNKLIEEKRDLIHNLNQIPITDRFIKIYTIYLSDLEQDNSEYSLADPNSNKITIRVYYNVIKGICYTVNFNMGNNIKEMLKTKYSFDPSFEEIYFVRILYAELSKEYSGIKPKKLSFNDIVKIISDILYKTSIESMQDKLKKEIKGKPEKVSVYRNLLINSPDTDHLTKADKFGMFDTVRESITSKIQLYTNKDIKLIINDFSKKYKNFEYRLNDDSLQMMYEVSRDMEVLIKRSVYIPTIYSHNNFIEIRTFKYVATRSFAEKHPGKYPVEPTSNYESKIYIATLWPRPADIDKYTVEEIKDSIHSFILYKTKEWIEYWKERIRKNPSLYFCMKKDGIKVELFEKEFKHLDKADKFGMFDTIRESTVYSTQMYDKKDLKFIVNELEKKYKKDINTKFFEIGLDFIRINFFLKMGDILSINIDGINDIVATINTGELIYENFVIRHFFPTPKQILSILDII